MVKKNPYWPDPFAEAKQRLHDRETARLQNEIAKLEAELRVDMEIYAKQLMKERWKRTKANALAVIARTKPIADEVAARKRRDRR